MNARTTPRLRLVQLDDRTTPAGLDPGFGTGGVVTVDLSASTNDLALASTTQPDGKVITLGLSSPDLGTPVKLTLTRLNVDGSPDKTFGGDGTIDLPVDGNYAGPISLGRSGSAQLAVLPDGKVVAVASGYAGGTPPNAPAQAMVARVNADGTPDTTFDGDGVATIALPGDGQAFQSLAVLADGSVVLVGPETVSQGPVSVFPPPGLQIPQPDEVVAVKLTPGGQLDGSFGTNGVVRLGTGSEIPSDARIAVLPDGKLLVYGEMLAPAPGTSPLGPNSIPGHRIFAMRLTATGAIDPTYGNGGRIEVGPDAGADSIALLGAGVAADGSLLVAAAQSTVNAGPSASGHPAYVFRVTPDGTIDTTFAGDSRFEIDTPYLLWNGGPWFTGMGVIPQAEGSIYLVAEGRAGSASGSGPLFDQNALVVERLTPAGSLDTTYGNGGLVVVPQSDVGSDALVPFDATADAQQRVVVSGRSVATNGDGVAGLVRIAPDAPTSPLPPSPTVTGPITGTISANGPLDQTLTADVNGDGTADTVTYSGPGGGTISIRDGRTGQTLVANYRPYEAGFTGGLVLVAADFNRDGRDELAVAPDVGGSARIEVLGFADGQLVVRDNYFAFDDPHFRGGARLAAGDVNGDGTPDLIVAAGPGGGPRVGMFDGTGLLKMAAAPRRLTNDFFAFGGTDAVNLRNGASVAVGDLNGDGRAELVFGAGPGGAPRVVVFDVGTSSAPVATFYAGGDTASRGGVMVTIADVDGDGHPELYAANGATGNTRAYRTPADLAAAGTANDPLGLMPGIVQTVGGPWVS
jgi:uncharacterized delta-60 repeat protein